MLYLFSHAHINFHHLLYSISTARFQKIGFFESKTEATLTTENESLLYAERNLLRKALLDLKA